MGKSVQKLLGLSMDNNACRANCGTAVHTVCSANHRRSSHGFNNSLDRFICSTLASTLNREATSMHLGFHSHWTASTQHHGNENLVGSCN